MSTQPSLDELRQHIALCTDYQQVLHARARFGDKHNWVALDTETMGKDWLRVTRALNAASSAEEKKQLRTELAQYSKQALDHRQNHLAVLQLAFDGDMSVVIILEDEIARAAALDWLYALKEHNPLWIIQNAKFDLHQLNWHLKFTFDGQRIHDTQINDVLIRGYADNDSSSLIALCQRYRVPEKFWKMDRGVAVSDWWGGLTEDQIIYASVDTLCLPYIARHQGALMKRDNLGEVAKIEAALIPRLVSMENKGLKFDKEKLALFIDAARKAQEQNHVGIREVFGDINFNSGQQVLDAFRRVYGDVPRKMAYDKKAKAFVESETVDKKAIIHCGFYGHEAVRAYLHYKEVGKQISDAVTWLNGPDKFLPSFNQVMVHRGGEDGSDGGARSGRLSASPNIQNIPDFMKQFLVADEGFVILDSDYAAIELRMMAQITGCKNLITIFNDPTRDPHTEMAAHAFKIPPEKIGKKSRERTLGKNCNFGYIFGMYPKRFGLQVAEATKGEIILSYDEAKGFHSAFFELNHEIAAWHIEQHARAAVRGYVETLAGRRRYYNVTERPLLDETRLRQRFWSAHTGWVADQLAVWRYNDWRWRNVAFNHPVQGTCADAMKLAIAQGGKQWCGRHLVASVHDAMTHVVPEYEVDYLARQVNDVMVEAMARFMPDIPVVVEHTVGRCWSAGPKDIQDPGLFVIQGDAEWCQREFQQALEIA